MAPDPSVRLTLPADASFLTVCRAALSGILADAADDEVEESKLVLSEVCAAAIAQHEDGGELELAFTRAPRAIEVEVRGPGPHTFLEDPVAREVVERLASTWHVNHDPADGRACVTFARALR